jgi:hypothetical protein
MTITYTCFACGKIEEYTPEIFTPKNPWGSVGHSLWEETCFLCPAHNTSLIINLIAKVRAKTTDALTVYLRKQFGEHLINNLGDDWYEQ